MGSLADIALQASQRNQANQQAVDIVTFVEASWGLDVALLPVQRVILKAHYGLALDDTTKNVTISDWRRENFESMTEAEYLRKLYREGRSNIKEVIPGKQRRELVLAVGRRSGKTFLCACVVAYEVYKLILKHSPQGYYGLPNTNIIGLVSVATDMAQAKLLYEEASGHFVNCGFFKQFTANNTMSYAKFQTPADIDRFGRYVDDPTAKATVNVTFKSCVAKGLRGPGNIVIILDELAHFNDAGQSDAAKIYKAVKPSLAAFSPKDPNDSRIPIGPVEGRILSISSPLGQEGKFYELFRMGFTGGLESRNMLCIQAPTWEVNPTISATFLAGEYAGDPEGFFGEYGADFTNRKRTWIPRKEDLLACVDPTHRPALKALPLVPHFMGLDISAGLVDGDYCALAIGHLIPEGRIVLDYIERIRAGEGDYEGLERLTFDEIGDWIYKLSRRFYITSGIFDQWAGIPFEGAIHKRGLTQIQSVFFTKPVTSQIFQNFKDMMYDKRLVLFDWPLPNGGDGGQHCEYIQEVLELQATVHSKYLITVEATGDNFDDYGDALVRMVYEATKYLGNRKYISGQTGKRRGSPVSSMDIARATAKAKQRSRFGGSHAGRQRHPLMRNRTRGKR